jgi:hypothetical protein
MDRYQVADSPHGPWIELEVTNNPNFALQKAVASFDWKVVWVAKMVPIRGSDILPPQEVLWGEMLERISILNGSDVAEELREILDDTAFQHVEVALTGHLLDREVEVLVPSIKHAYGRLQTVRATDFTGLPARKPSLKELLDEG